MVHVFLTLCFRISHPPPGTSLSAHRFLLKIEVCHHGGFPGLFQQIKLVVKMPKCIFSHSSGKGWGGGRRGWLEVQNQGVNGSVLS